MNLREEFVQLKLHVGLATKEEAMKKNFGAGKPYVC